MEVKQDQDLEEGDKEIIMRLAPLYQQDREQAILEGEQRGEQRGIQQGIQQGVQQGIQQGVQQGIQQGVQQGIQQGERLVIQNLLQVRFGCVDEELAEIIEPLLALPPEEFTPMLLQLSREELLARFRESN
ncbi:MAG: hypothetical protein F6J86_03375 [Symploca sp. SIO1B1]|nr:hypothetical protein [Symploca sp. SIO1B1]